MRLNLGCGPIHHPGYLNIDGRAPADLVFDLDNMSERHAKLPIETNSVTEIVASHFLEHLHDTLGLMSELYRVAVPECKMIIRVPFGQHQDAIDDQTHVRKFGPYTFRFFSQPWYHNNYYGYDADWEINQVTMCCHMKYKHQHKLMGHDGFLDWVQRHWNVCYALHCEGYAVKPARERSSAHITWPTITFDFA